MIPGLPKWDPIDMTSKAYQGSQVKPPPEEFWEHYSLSLGPKEYGVPNGNLAERWWAVYIQRLNEFQAMWIIPARLDGLGWDRPRLWKTYSYARFPTQTSLGFDKNGHAVVSILHGPQDNYGPPNAITTFYHGVDYNGDPGIDDRYIMNIRCPVVANAKPTDPDTPVYLFFIDVNNILCYVTDAGTGTIDFSKIVKSSQLGPTWEILHGGYRIDAKFQVAFRHDPDDPYPEQVVEIIEYDYFEMASSAFSYAEVTTDYFPIPSIQDGSIENITPTAISDTVGAKLTALTAVKVSSPLVSELPIEEFIIPALNVSSIKLTSPVKVVNTPIERITTTATKPKNVILETVIVPVNINDSEFVGVPVITSAKLTTL